MKDATLRLRKADPEKAVDALEQKVGFRLPAPLHAYFRSELRGRVRPTYDPSLQAPLDALLGAKGALSNWTTMMGIRDWDPDWIPIAHDGAGNLHFVVVKRGKVGFASQDPYGRVHGKLTLERWLLQFGVRLPKLPREVTPVTAPPSIRAARSSPNP